MIHNFKVFLTILILFGGYCAKFQAVQTQNNADHLNFHALDIRQHLSRIVCNGYHFLNPSLHNCVVPSLQNCVVHLAV